VRRTVASIFAPPTGWRLATAQELIEVYNMLKRTGKANFGNRLYLSGTTITCNYNKQVSSGTDLRRKAVAYVPWEAERPFMFPGYEMILAGGGPSPSYYHVMDMADGAIIHAKCEHTDSLWIGFRADDQIGGESMTYKNIVFDFRRRRPWRLKSFIFIVDFSKDNNHTDKTWN
jgi:hypothetical protein